jgi:hypothetical protein
MEALLFFFLVLSEQYLSSLYQKREYDDINSHDAGNGLAYISNMIVVDGAKLVIVVRCAFFSLP